MDNLFENKNNFYVKAQDLVWSSDLYLDVSIDKTNLLKKVLGIPDWFPGQQHFQNMPKGQKGKFHLPVS